MGGMKIRGAIVGLGFGAELIPIDWGCQREQGQSLIARLTRRALVLVAIVACPALAHGQEYRATLTGLVTDAQGLMLPGVAVTATQVEPPPRTKPSPTQRAHTPSRCCRRETTTSRPGWKGSLGWFRKRFV